MNNNKYIKAKKIIEGLNTDPSHSLVIHYSRQNLMDNESGIATPRIIAIMVKSLDGKQNHCFAIHHEAEKAEIILENITDFYDQLEERLLRSFNSFVKNNRDCKWIHWDMNDVHFGFEAIKHRYCVMVDENGKDFQEIENHNRINLNTLLINIYGANYEKDPQLENLMKTNNDGVTKKGHLTLEEEAKVFKNLGFPSILESLRCKVNFLIEVVDKATNGNLKVSSKYWINKLKAFITHPITATISILLTLLSIILKVVSLFGN